MRRIMRLLHRITRTSMRSRKDLIPLLLLGIVQRNIHKFIHSPSHKHIAIQKNHPLEPRQGENNQFVPCLVEARVRLVFPTTLWLDCWYGEGSDVARFQSFEAFGGEGGGV